MDDSPLAYHITFGTYGTRLHGDPRGTIDRRCKAYGQPIVEHSEAREQIAAERMKHQPILFTVDQCVFAQAAVEEICERGRWEFIQTACGPDHVHVLLKSERKPKAIRRWLKRWLGEAMTARWPLPDGQSWWAKGGSAKCVWEEKYLRNVEQYIREQRA
jgi:REP element-mobilizing transposase RayT